MACRLYAYNSSQNHPLKLESVQLEVGQALGHSRLDGLLQQSAGEVVHIGPNLEENLLNNMISVKFIPNSISSFIL